MVHWEPNPCAWLWAFPLLLKWSVMLHEESTPYIPRCIAVKASYHSGCAVRFPSTHTVVDFPVSQYHILHWSKHQYIGDKVFTRFLWASVYCPRLDIEPQNEDTSCSLETCIMELWDTWCIIHGITATLLVPILPKLIFGNQISENVHSVIQLYYNCRHGAHIILWHLDVTLRLNFFAVKISNGSLYSHAHTSTSVLIPW